MSDGSIWIFRALTLATLIGKAPTLAVKIRSDCSSVCNA